ncbi:Gfo/Idh/MocA family protein [Phytoactinopolyspora halotolerans]|uniref:Gfo/Idh/MocA family oxidoreductase n=1 Tax=Phytoactinopolyspora halotolerans TaxID=1981512 RepID=A0A6L9SB75_9ACTN|nr:Gfo/Idh/MocA family oxidoreductase [Phytoactinopolyspora halotolerans]NEE02303.1 Gfo/Idh/MocA family oxidoreductase [Phytoactinopolyspora halotolerans]
MTRTQNDGETLRIGVVGAGIMGTSNARAVNALAGAELTAITSGTRESAEKLAGEFGGRPQVFDDYEQLIDSGPVDAVVVATPDHLHADVVVKAAAAGKHILVEKPFTTSVQDADRCVRAVREAGVIAMCIFNHRWVPAYAQAKDLIAGLGSPAVGYARKDDTIYVPTEMLNWAQNTTCAWFLSSHDIDLVTWFFDDEVEQVYATARYGKLRSLGIDTPDAIQIQARYRRGAVATFESAWIYPNTFPTMVDSYITAICDDGVIQLDRQQENVVMATPDGVKFPRNMLKRTVHGVLAGAYPDAVAHFVDCATRGVEPLITVESSRHVTAVLEAAHASIASGQPVAVPEPGRTVG